MVQLRAQQLASIINAAKRWYERVYGETPAYLKRVDKFVKEYGIDEDFFIDTLPF